MRRVLSDHRSASIYVLICTAVCAVMFWLTPYNHDDLYYRLPYIVADTHGASVTEDLSDVSVVGASDIVEVSLPPASQFADFFADHYLHNNGRIGDKLLTLALLLPKTIFVLLNALAVFVILNAGRFISPSLRGATQRVVCASLMILCLPWYDLMFTGAFAVNYLWGGALALICFGYMTGALSAHTKVAQCAVCLLMILAGGWHEGYAMTVAAAIFVYLCCNRFKVSKVQILYWVMWIIGVGVVMFSPSSWDRMDASGSPFSWSRVFSIETVAYMNITLIYPLAVLLTLIVKRMRRRVDVPTRIILIAIAVMLLVNIYIVGRTYWVARIAMFSMIFTLPGLVLLCQKVKSAHTRRSLVFVKRAVVTVLVCAVALNMSASIYWQKAITEEFNRVRNEYIRDGGETTMYCDLTTEDTLPWYTLWKPSGYILHNAWGLNTFTMYYGKADSHSPIYILPTALRGVNPCGEGKQLQSDKFTLWDVNGYLIAEGFPEGRSRKVKCRTSDGIVQWIYVMVTPFKGTDGKEYSYLEPVYNLSDNHSRIVEIIKYKSDK